MGVLKLLGYLVAAVAVLTALAMSALFVLVSGFIIGIAIDVIGGVIFTAYALKNYFNSDK